MKREEADPLIDSLEKQVDSLNLLYEEHLKACTCTRSEKSINLHDAIKEAKINLHSAIAALRDLVNKG